MYVDVALTMKSPQEMMLGVQGLQILDRNGEVIYDVANQPGSNQVVPLQQISPNLINATVATEDANFWQNPGVNFKGLARAVYENLAFWKHGGFFKGSGGSSVTQQLAKNLYIPPDQRYERNPLRKLKETMIAVELNRRYSKEQIMQWYLSNIFYGEGAYGIDAASHRYFDKAPIDLDLAEATLLAGIPRSPSYYDPITNFDAAKQRQEEVLSLMVRNRFITQDEADAAAAEQINLQEGRLPEATVTSDVGIHFALYVKGLLPDLIGKDKAKGDLRVTTTLDLNLQKEAEQIVATKVDSYASLNATNGALVAMDPTTGEILAMVGSRDFNDDSISGQVNNAIALNQPGSSIKPVTYLTAFMKGWSPDTPIVDEPITLGSGDNAYTLNNADLWYRGNVTARTGLGNSLNVPAVKTERYAGLQNVYIMAKRLGLTTLKDLSFYGDSFTLGGEDVTLLDMTYVYSVFANGGVQTGIDSTLGLPPGNRDLDPIAVLKVETADGKVLWQADPKSERVAPADKVAEITNILSDDTARYSMFGPHSPLDLQSRPAAVKSGLTDDARDAWAIGYTPQLVVGVWVGNANNVPMKGATSTYTAAPIWNAFMTTALQGQPVLALDGQAQTPAVTPDTPTPQPPSPTPSPEPTEAVTPELTSTPAITATRRVTSPTATQSPTRTSTPRATRTPRPTHTPKPTQTAPAGETPQGP